MNHWLAAALAGLVFLGCSWAPDRDNPVDPRSQNFVSPPQRNRAPEVDTVLVRSDCRYSALNPFCSFDVISQISDSDGNLNYEAVLCSVGVYSLGPMSFDPLLRQFRVSRSQNDFPGEYLDQLTVSIVRVSVTDDSGSTAERTISFPAPVRLPAPNILYPEGDPAAPVWIQDDSVRLGWSLWEGIGGNHTFGVAVFYKNIFMVWDTAGLVPTDTFIVVTDTLEPSTLNSSLFYTWYLTVTDGLGNRLTSLPGYFKYFPPSEPLAARKPEDGITD